MRTTLSLDPNHSTLLFSPEGAKSFILELWRNKQSDVLRFLSRLRAWKLRQLPAVHRVEHPTNPAKARAVGYRAKQGYVVIRSRIRRGNRKKQNPKGIVYGKPTHQGVNELKGTRNLRAIAEEKAARKATNLRVLNSYWVCQDSTYKWYEVILVDPSHNAIRNDPKINWICRGVHKHRENRGLTSAGRKYRGLRAPKTRNTSIRPSRRAAWKRNNTTKLHRYR